MKISHLCSNKISHLCLANKDQLEKKVFTAYLVSQEARSVKEKKFICISVRKFATAANQKNADLVLAFQQGRRGPLGPAGVPGFSGVKGSEGVMGVSGPKGHQGMLSEWKAGRYFCPEAYTPTMRLTQCSSKGCLLETKFENDWGTVCSSGFGEQNAVTLCKAFGFPGGGAPVPNIGGGQGPVWLDDVQCLGAEGDVGDCRHAPWLKNNCAHAQDAGLCCWGGHPTGKLDVNSPQLKFLFSLDSGFRTYVQPSWCQKVVRRDTHASFCFMA